MKVKAVIFDFDDTLTDNKKLDLESFRYLAHILGLYVPRAREIKELRKSLLAKDIVSWMMKKSSKSVPLETCLEIRNDFLERENERLIIVKPKTRSTLLKLESQGRMLFIATTRLNTTPVKAILREYGLNRFFKRVYGKNSGNKTDIYNKILLDTNLAPNECLVVSDSFHDLSQALNLGMRAVGVLGSYGAHPSLNGKVEVLKNLSKLNTYVKRCD